MPPEETVFGFPLREEAGRVAPERGGVNVQESFKCFERGLAVDAHTGQDADGRGFLRRRCEFLARHVQVHADSGHEPAGRAVAGGDVLGEYAGDLRRAVEDVVRPFDMELFGRGESAHEVEDREGRHCYAEKRAGDVLLYECGIDVSARGNPVAVQAAPSGGLLRSGNEFPVREFAEMCGGPGVCGIDRLKENHGSLQSSRVAASCRDERQRRAFAGAEQVCNAGEDGGLHSLSAYGRQIGGMLHLDEKGAVREKKRFRMPCGDFARDLGPAVRNELETGGAAGEFLLHDAVEDVPDRLRGRQILHELGISAVSVPFVKNGAHFIPGAAGGGTLRRTFFCRHCSARPR